MFSNLRRGTTARRLHFTAGQPDRAACIDDDALGLHRFAVWAPARIGALICSSEISTRPSGARSRRTRVPAEMFSKLRRGTTARAPAPAPAPLRTPHTAEEASRVRLAREHQDVDGDRVAHAAGAGFAAWIDEDAQLGLGELVAGFDGGRLGPGRRAGRALAPVGEVAARAQ